MRPRLLVVLGIVAGGLAGPALPAEAGGGGGCHGPVTEGTGTTVETRNACFTPTVLRVPVGTTVRFANRDGLDHHISGVAVDFAELGYRQTASQRFDAPGIYAYQCALHPTMTGAVVVGDGRRTDRAVLASSTSGGQGDSDGRANNGWWPLLALVSLAGAATAIVLERHRAGKGDAGRT